MPSYAVQTGKIIGCKPNTLAWWHETRHKQQFEKYFPFLKKIYSYNTFLLLFTIILFLHWWWLAILPVTIGLFLEIDAWAWSIWKMNYITVK